MFRIVAEPVRQFQLPSTIGLLAVDNRVEVAAVATTPALLELETGETFTLDRTDKLFDVWAGLLKDREGSRRSVYLEADDDRRVTRLLVPQPNVVLDISEASQGEGLVIRTLGSPEEFLLRPERFGLLDSLQTSMSFRLKVQVTTDPATRELLHVRPFEATASFPCEFPDPEIPVLTRAQAQESFDSLASQAHLRFDFPKNFCTARAHEMCRLLRVGRIQCRKVWNYGRLRFTPPLSTETFEWYFHVAPTVQVEPEDGDQGDPVEMVLDPALSFTGPASIQAWKDRLQDDDARHEFSMVDVFWRSIFAVDTDPDPNCFLTRTGLEGQSFSRRLMTALAQG